MTYMNKRILFLLASVIILCLSGAVFAQSTIQLQPPIPFGNFCKLFTDGILPIISGLVGGISVIMFMISGFMFLASAGSPEKMATAKKALIYAIIGIVISLAAGLIATTIRDVFSVTGTEC
jgi:hypothetical protein